MTTFSDASHVGPVSSYCQAGVISGLMMLDRGSGKAIYHAIPWALHNQRRVSHSCFVAETLACFYMDERGHFRHQDLRDLFPLPGINI